MAEILLCNQAISSSSIKGLCGVLPSDITEYGCSVRPTSLKAYRPYLVGENPSLIDRTILSHFGSADATRNLTDHALSLGADNTLALAEIAGPLKEYLTGALEASTGVYGDRVRDFGAAVKKYQDALMEYRQAIKISPTARSAARLKAISAFQKMQTYFQNELAAMASTSTPKKGTPLSDPTRAINIANSSRTVAKLNITSQTQASNLVKYSRYAKYLGNGLVVIDFGARVGNIHTSYKAGGRWERELFIESTSFAMSAGAGAAVVSAGGAALSFLVAATPVGWVGLVIGGTVIAGAAAASAMGMNTAVKSNSGDWYDAIMKSLQSK